MVRRQNGAGQNGADITAQTKRRGNKTAQYKTAQTKRRKTELKNNSL
jgi:hypothetical protein